MKLGRIRAGVPGEIRPVSHLPSRMAMFNTPAIDLSSRVDEYPMLGNDTVGDCTIAAAAHIIHTWTAWTDTKPVVMDTETVLSVYEVWCGYNPSDPSTDRGALCIDILKNWARAGMPTPGGGPDIIDGVAYVETPTYRDMYNALRLYGPIYAGLALPLSAQHEEVWETVIDPPGSWGGHCVAIVGVAPDGATCITWGQRKRMTWPWLDAYLDEAYAILSRDWLSMNGQTPAGLPFDELREDLLNATPVIIPAKGPV